MPLYRLYKDRLQIHLKKRQFKLKKEKGEGVRVVNSHFTKKNIKKIASNLINNQGNTNYNHNEISPQNRRNR